MCFYSQMEFVIESRYGISITAGDLLLTTCSNHEILWIGCVFIDDVHGYYITAASTAAINGDLAVDKFAHRSNNYIQNVTRCLFTYGGVIDGKWQPVPRHLWAEIYELVYSQVY